jgi:translocator protein
MKRPSSKTQSVLALAGFLALTFCAPLAGVTSMPDAWYASLEKPSWNPPAWIFGPVWTLLYTLMAVAAWLVWKREGWGSPMWLYLVQLSLNAAWTPVFFGAHAPGWALLVIAALWVAIVATTFSFFRVRKAAGLLFAPYLAWVTFAAFLNFTLWRLNPS